MKTYEESERAGHSDTEITLGTRSILGIFFALALICGVFFGFGYSLGRGNASKASLGAQAAAQPAALTPASAPAPIQTVVEQSAATDGSEPKPQAGAPIAASPLAATPVAALPSAAAPAATPASVPQVTKAAYSAPASGSAAPASYPPQATPAQSFIMVQIAAVSRRDDADALVTALQKLGYRVSVRSDPVDQLLHIQIGPVATRDAAKAMRARLLNDGYNAILK